VTKIEFFFKKKNRCRDYLIAMESSEEISDESDREEYEEHLSYRREGVSSNGGVNPAEPLYHEAVWMVG
jgi:hypothetical protein